MVASLQYALKSVPNNLTYVKMKRKNSVWPDWAKFRHLG
jgi:hypothetical protein